MTDNDSIPDWVKVKIAAVFGVGAPWAASLLDHFGPVLDVLIKAGQAGVVLFTVLYTYTKWRKLRAKK